MKIIFFYFFIIVARCSFDMMSIETTCIKEIPVYPGMVYLDLTSDTTHILSEFYELNGEPNKFKKLYWTKYGIEDPDNEDYAIFPSITFEVLDDQIINVNYSLHDSQVSNFTTSEYEDYCGRRFQKLLPCVEGLNDRISHLDGLDTMVYQNYQITLDNRDTLNYTIKIELKD